MGTTEKYPIDFDALRKGSIIGADMLTNLFKLDRNDSRYNLACMQLAETVRTVLEERGVDASVCIRKGAIMVLDDAQGSEYERKQGRLGVRKIKRAFRRLVKNVDVRNLTPDQLKAHDAGILRMGWVVGQISTMPPLPDLRAHRSLITETGAGVPQVG